MKTYGFGVPQPPEKPTKTCDIGLWSSRAPEEPELLWKHKVFGAPKAPEEPENLCKHKVLEFPGPSRSQQPMKTQCFGSQSTCENTGAPTASEEPEKHVKNTGFWMWLPDSPGEP